jgi:hypothetical protein
MSVEMNNKTRLTRIIKKGNLFHALLGLMAVVV